MNQQLTHMLTVSNTIFDFNNMDISAINIKDIACSLSKICRYNGQIPYFFSVAQHSLDVCNLVDDEYKLEALLHDASEAYLGDMITPLKNVNHSYKEQQRKLEILIAKKFGFPESLSEAVDLADKHALTYEFAYVRTGHIKGQSPEVIEQKFLDKFLELI